MERADDTERVSGFRGAWQHRPWRRLLGSYTLSMAADLFSLVPLTVFVIEATDSTGWIAVAAIARIVGNVLVGPVAGTIADRYDQRKLQIIANLGAAAVLLATALTAWASGPVAVVVALSTLSSIATLPVAPAALALTTDLVDEDDLAAANAAQSAIGQVAALVGPAAGALIVVIGDPGTGFVANALVLVGAAALLGSMPYRPSRPIDDDEAPLSVKVLATEVAEGGRLIRRDPAMLAVFALSALMLFQVGVLDVIQVLIVERQLGLGPGGVGYLAAATGVGGLLITPATARLGTARVSGAVLAGSGVLIGVPLVVLAIVESPVSALVLTAAGGVGAILFEVLYITMLQRLSPPAALARIFGFNDTVAAVGQLLGAGLAPLMIHHFDLDVTLLVTGGLIIGVSVLLGPALHRSAVLADDERKRLAPIVARLRPLAIFNDASQAALERLARATITVVHPAGHRVIEEGAPADDLFVVLGGTLEVTTLAAGTIDRLGPADWFGEVGLLHRMARTATVTTTTEVELLEIDGHAFMDAVSAPELLPDGLRRTIASRMRRAGRQPGAAPS